MNLVDGGGVLGGASGVIVGIRPEDLRLDPEGPIEVRVEAVESLGNEAVLLTRHADGHRLAVRTAPRQKIRAGDGVRMRVTDERVHHFDRETGRRR